jgi:hypothetical protein
MRILKWQITEVVRFLVSDVSCAQTYHCGRRRNRTVETNASQARREFASALSREKVVRPWEGRACSCPGRHGPDGDAGTIDTAREVATSAANHRLEAAIMP